MGPHASDASGYLCPLTMVREYGKDLKLKLWHEVSVLTSEDQIFAYLNCHHDTGLLPYFSSTEITKQD
jgi:aldoxime dehydratase